jgi:hypothetical protein
MSAGKVRDWAAYAEIIGTVAVVISLVFVVQSIDQNTRAVEAAEMNNIYAGWREAVIVPILHDPDLADTIAKARAGDALTPGEQIRWAAFVGGKMDIWSQMFGLHQDGVISTEAWQEWEGGFWAHWDIDQMASTWARHRGMYGEAFRQYIDTDSKERGSQN